MSCCGGSSDGDASVIGDVSAVVRDSGPGLGVSTYALLLDLPSRIVSAAVHQRVLASANEGMQRIDADPRLGLLNLALLGQHLDMVCVCKGRVTVCEECVRGTQQEIDPLLP